MLLSVVIELGADGPDFVLNAESLYGGNQACKGGGCGGIAAFWRKPGVSMASRILEYLGVQITETLARCQVDERVLRAGLGPATKGGPLFLDVGSKWPPKA